MVEKYRLFKEQKILLLTLLILALCGCNPDSKISVSTSKKAIVDTGSIVITNVKVVNHQVIITGKNLNTVTDFKIKEGSSNTILDIESKNKTTLIANTLTNVTFAAGKVFDFILSNASAAATFTVDFSLCDSTLGGKSIACSIAPTDKQVLSYDASTGKWRPRSVNGLGYKGVWGSLPTLPAVGALVPGDYFIVSVAQGAYNVGDWLVLNDDGVTFEQVENSTQIISVFGRTGAIVATKNDYNLNLLSDVDLTTTPPSTGDGLVYNGVKWIAGPIAPTGAAGAAGGDLSGTYPNPSIGSNKITDTHIANAAISQTKINGLTSALSGKEPSITAAATTTYFRGDKTFVTLNSTVVPEGTNLYFTNARALGVPLAGFDNALTGPVTAADSMLQAFGRVQNQINSLTSGGSNYLLKNAADTLSGAVSVTNVITASGAGDIVVHSIPLTMTSAVNKTYADGKLDKTTGGTVSGVVTLDDDLKIQGGTNYVTIKGHATSANYNFVLPVNAGTAGYVLSTDGSGNTSWITVGGGGAPSGSAGGDLSGSYPNPTISALDAAKVGGGAVSNTEFSYLDGVTSSIQTQLNAKLSAETDPSVTAFAKAALPNCSAGQVLKGNGTSLSCVADNAGGGAYSGGNNFVVVTDGSGALSDSTITTTKLGYLSGVSSDIQTQLNAKQTTISKTTTQDVSKIRIYGANATNYVELSAATLTGNRSLIFPDSDGTTGQALTTDGAGVLSWTTVSGGGAPTGAAGGDLSGTYPNPTITALDAAKIGGGAVSNTEYSYLDGVTSSIQTQLTGKEPAITAGTTAQYLRGDKSLATFATDVRATTLTGLSSTAGTIAAGDTVLAAFGKMLNTQSDYVSKSGSTTVTGSFNIVGITAFLNIPTPTGATLTEAANVDYVQSFGQWTKSGSDAYRSGGNVSIGSTPVTNTKLNVEGQIRSKSFSGSSAAVDWANGNSGTTSFDCGTALTFASLRDGGSYTLAVTGTGTTQCSFSTTTTGDDAGTVSYRFIPANAVRTASSHTIYSLQRIGSIVYVSWITGF